MTSPAGPRGEPQATLVVIDMQRVFGESDSPWFTPRFAEVVGPIQRLVGAYRPRVVFTRFVAPAVPAGAWRRYYEVWPFALQPPDARIYELVDEFAGEPFPTVEATTFGKVGDELDAIKEKTNTLAQASMKLGEAMYKAQQSETAAADAAAAGAGNKPEDNVVDADFEEVDDTKKGAA